MALAGSPIGEYAPPEVAAGIDQQMDAQRQQNQVQQQWAQHYQDFQGAVQQHAADQAQQFGDFQDAVHQHMNSIAEQQQAAAGSEESPFSYQALQKRVLELAGSKASGVGRGTVGSPPSSVGGPTLGQGGPGGFQDQGGSSTQSQFSGGGSSPAMGGGGDVVSAIHAATDDPRVHMAMKLGASLEGGLGPTYGAGDGGMSWGPFQINHNAGMHQNIDRAGSEDPATATKYMLGEYQAAVEKVPPDMWQSDPKQASRLAAYYAERPAVIYDQGRVDAAWNALQKQQGDQTMAQQTGGGLQDYLDQTVPMPPVASQSVAPSAAPSPSDQQTPVAQYNEETPGGLGNFRQVTKMAGGNYQAEPTAQPSADQQAVYDAQQAATGGFQTPEMGAPLLASGQSATPIPTLPESGVVAPTSLEPGATTPSPQTLSDPQSGLPRNQDGTLIAGTPPPTGQTEVSPQKSNSSPQNTPAMDAMGNPTNPADFKSMLADALHQVADTIGGKVQDAGQAVLNAGGATPELRSSIKTVGDDLGQAGQYMTSPHPLDMSSPTNMIASSTPFQAVQGAGRLASDAANMVTEAAVPGAPTAQKEWISRNINPAPYVVGGAIGKLAEPVLANVLSKGMGVAIDAAGKPVAEATLSSPSAVAAASSDLMDAVAQPVIGGGAAGANPVIDSLNGLIGTMQDGVKAAKTPQAALTATSMADQAALSLSRGLDDAYTAMKLTPAEAQHVADVLEGIPASATGPVSQKAIDAADAFKQTTDATAAMAKATGTLKETIENYFTHMVRVPAAETTAGNGVTPGVLSEWSRFAQGRARDEAGNVLMPTLRDLSDYVAAEHPTWQVVTDVPTLVAAHVQSMVTAANHAALGDILVGARDAGQYAEAIAAGKTPAQARMLSDMLSPVQRRGDVQVNLPASLSRWLYRGTTPEEGAVAITRSGVVGGSSEGQAVMEKMPLLWAKPEMAKMLNRYAAADMIAPNVLGPVGQKMGQLYDKINGGIVSNKLLNLLVHGENMASEMSQYMDPRQAAGFLADRAAARAVMNDPAAMTELLQKAPLNLPQIRSFARELAERTGNIQDEARVIPGLSGLGDAANKVAITNHELLFNQLGQRLQLQSYFGALRQGMDEATAARYANAKFGQFSDQDLNSFTRWVNVHTLFAGRWLTGRMLQYQALLGKTGYGGYASDLSPAAQKALSNSLRGDFLKGTAALVGAHTMTNLALGESTNGGPAWPWTNAPGRWMDVNVGKIAPGQYLTDPFFKGQQDLLKFMTAPISTPGTAIQRAAGSVAVAANKVAPLLGMARNQVAGEQYAGGPAIMGAKDDPGQQLKDELGFLAASILPGGEHINAFLNPRVHVGDSGIVGTLLNIRSLGTPGQKSTGGTGAPKAPAGPKAPAAPH